MYYIILKYRKRFNNLTVTSNTRLEISFQVQKKFQSQLKSYNGGITLAWAILVDKDKFNKKHKKPPNLRPWCLSSRQSSHAPSTSAGLGFSATKVRQTELPSVRATDSVWTTTSYHPHPPHVSRGPELYYYEYQFDHGKYSEHRKYNWELYFV